jgi:hypothetical protein
MTSAVGATQRKINRRKTKKINRRKTKAGTMNGQRRRRVGKLAPGVSPGKQITNDERRRRGRKKTNGQKKKKSIVKNKSWNYERTAP